MRLLFFSLFLYGHLVIGQFQDVAKVHSHNDYKQVEPFWDAYNGRAGSIEVDIFLKNDTLFVTHHKDEIITDRTIESLYLEPIQELLTTQLDSIRRIQLLIDVKSWAKPTLKTLIDVLADYESLVKNKNISFVISGNRPSVEEYPDYPDYILFDHQSLSDIEDAAIWKKIALISLPFYKHSQWDGKTRLTGLEYRKIRTPIDLAHKYGKPFRFWATPDTRLAWETLSRMGMDFINTDHPSKCFTFLDSIKKEHR